MSRPSHEHDPAAWAAFASAHGVDDVVDGDVVDVVPFGAFVRVDGVDGFAPQSSWPALPAVGSRVPVRIVAIDADRHRFAVDPA